jgi:hypothetical protein
MAGPGIGVWVKVKTKSGVTPRVIPNKDGGGQYSQGQVITQSEFNELRQKRAERLQGEQAVSLSSLNKGRSLSEALEKAGIRSVDDIPEPIKKEINAIHEEVTSKHRKELAKLEKSAKVLDYATSDLSWGVVENNKAGDLPFRTKKEKNKGFADSRKAGQLATKQGRNLRDEKTLSGRIARVNPAETIEVYTLGVLQQTERFGNSRQIKRARDLHKKAVDMMNNLPGYISYDGKNWMKEYANDFGVDGLVSQAMAYRSRKQK